jgi:membrane associated rhomboid family serine protease
MGIYNRDYIRELQPEGGLDTAPVVKYLIIANVVVFLLQIFWVREVRLSPLDYLRRQGIDATDPEFDELLKEDKLDRRTHTERISVLQEWCELDTNKIIQGGQVWRLLTHAFCHDRYGLYHIVINMLCLYWFGTTLEYMYGSREFLLFYLTAAVVAGLAFVGLQVYTGSSVPAIGASGAVMAVMMLYTMHFPTEEILVCWFFPLQMRWVMLFFVIWDLHPILLALAGDRVFTGVANAAHLGGLAFGFLYARYEWHLESLAERLPGLRWQARPRPRLRPARVTCSEPRDPESCRMDEVLQKIYESGQDSLTAEERAFLENASARLRGRRRGEE